MLTKQINVKNRKFMYIGNIRKHMPMLFSYGCCVEPRDIVVKTKAGRLMLALCVAHYMGNVHHFFKKALLTRLK